MKAETIYDILKREHEAVQALLDKLDETEGAARTRLFEQLKENLLPHMHAEESVFYSILRDHGDSHETALDAKEEHRAANHVIRELDRLNPENELWRARFHVLKENIEHHVRMEESKVFKQARQMLDHEQAAALGRQFLAVKREFIAEQGTMRKAG